MKAYHDLLKLILAEGNDRGDRTGTGTRSYFGAQFRHNLADGFPLLTTKKIPFKSIVVELLWFLRGDTNIKYLLENGCHIWSADAHRMYSRHQKELADIRSKGTQCEVWPELTIEEFEAGVLANRYPAREFADLGPVYGKQWRSWNRVYPNPDGKFLDCLKPIDQIKGVIESIRNNPEGRRHIVTAWNPAEVDRMALPPCHCLFQFYVADNRLSCHMYQRSADVFLGVPFNIASYALLTHIVAHQTGLGVGELVISFGDVHIYNNHRDQVAEQLTREPRPLPTLTIAPPITDKVHTPAGYMLGDFILEEYDPHPAIKGELSVGT